jgi:hypothetical protein
MAFRGGREFFTERTLHRTFLSFAKYFTPFFVMSRGSNMAYWLVGCVPGGGVRAVGKWPAGATVQILAEAGHLSTAVVIATLR